MTTPQTPPTHMWLPSPLPPAVATALQRLQKADDVHHIAVMPDVHLAADVCVGIVLATTRLIYPNAVGGDIGCGMAALAFDCDASLLAHKDAANRLMAGLYQTVPTNRHPKPQPLPQTLADYPLTHPRLESIKRRDAAVQFATLGRGNHFLEFQSDESGRLWLMVHSGSRAIGQAIRDLHLHNARPIPAGLKAIPADTPQGQAYLSDMTFAVLYAAANRRAIIDAVANLFSSLFSTPPLPETYLACDHNHVRSEQHFGHSLYVHRKGAIPASLDEPGIIPGSMASESYHVAGRAHPDSLRSSSHGAGRAMSRDEARRRISPHDLARQLDGLWYDHRLAHHLRDEAPAAYKDIRAVMRAQRDLTRIVRKLTPILCYKGA